MALSGQIIHLVGLDFLQNAGQVRTVGKIAIMKLEAHIARMRIFKDMIDTLGIEGRGAALDAMHFIALLKQKFSQI